MEYYKRYYAVAGMWIFRSIWLRYFEFGPVEWVWRSLNVLEAATDADSAVAVVANAAA